MIGRRQAWGDKRGKRTTAVSVAGLLRPEGFSLPNLGHTRARGSVPRSKMDWKKFGRRSVTKQSHGGGYGKTKNHNQSYEDCK